MEEQGTVSLWLGRAKSADALWAALDVQFSDDGDSIGSEFSRAFGIDCYDDALREAEFYDAPGATLAEFFRGASHESTVLSRFMARGVTVEPGTNCLVLLYDCRHSQPSTAQLTGVAFTCMGAVSYR